MMNYKLTITPAIPVLHRHDLQDVLERLGYDVIGGGTYTDGSQSDITFDDGKGVEVGTPSTKNGILLKDFVSPSIEAVLDTPSVGMRHSLIYLGKDGMCRWLYKPQLSVIYFSSTLVSSKYNTPVKILEASGVPGYQSPGHPPGAHIDGKDMDDRYQELDGGWHWSLHWDFWSLLKLFIPGVRISIGPVIELILLERCGLIKLPLWFSVDTNRDWHHDFDLDDVRSKRGICHAHISGLNTDVNWEAEVPERFRESDE